MPACFKANHPATPIIIDCTEPSSFHAQSQTYSSYRSHNNAWGLVGIAPSGNVTFISGLYASKCVTLSIQSFCEEKSSCHLKTK